MNRIEQYKQYRKVGMQLNGKIIESADSDLFIRAAGLLNMLKGNTVVFEEEYEQDVLMDFIINERLNEDKSLVQTFLQTHRLKNDIENEILNAIISSYTSLFRIKSICRDEKLIILEDILNAGDEVKLTDISFSETASLEMLLFTRIVPFENLCITSGISFPFPADQEGYLLRRYKRIMRKLKMEDESIAKFIAFFELNRTEGLLVSYHKVR